MTTPTDVPKAKATAILFRSRLLRLIPVGAPYILI